MSDEIVETLKWEIGLLMDAQKALVLVGRSLPYYEELRLKDLRTRLDAACGYVEPEKEELK